MMLVGSANHVAYHANKMHFSKREDKGKVGASTERGVALMVEPCPLIEPAGAPRERGCDHGRTARARIATGIAHHSE